MANLWQFFGLPNPEGPNNDDRKSRANSNKAKMAKAQEDASQQTLIPIEEEPTNEGPEVQSDLPKMETPQFDSNLNLVPVPPGWKGPISADGDPCHDLGLHQSTRRSFPSRALRYVAPDEMKRIPTRGIGKRISTGDTVIVDLRSLVHMDAHQNACRRELKMMCEEIGVEVFALDSEDKLLMLSLIHI